MNPDRRKRPQLALVVGAAQRLSRLRGCVPAWRYLRAQSIGSATALRVLSPQGPRRISDDQYATRQAGRPGEGGPALQAAPSHRPDSTVPERRTNLVIADICDHAVALVNSESRQYAEGLLRIYGLKTATVMRVLFDSRQRRGAGMAGTLPFPSEPD